MGFFDGIAGAATGGLLNLAGGIFSNNAQKDIAQNAMNFSAEQTRQQMDFQREMRSTQYQTAVEDMTKAGINPMMAYSQGGAGTPAGAAAVGQQAQIKNPTEGLAHSAATIANIKADLALKDTQATKNVADTTTSEQQAKLLDAQTNSEVMRMPGIPESIKQTIAQTELLKAQKELNSAQTSKTAAEAFNISTGEKAESISKKSYYEKAPYNPFMFRDIIQGGSSAANILKGLKK